jgi:hypothetical protein
LLIERNGSVMPIDKLTMAGNNPTSAKQIGTAPLIAEC